MRYRDASHVAISQWRAASRGGGPWIHALGYALLAPAVLLPAADLWLAAVAAAALLLWLIAWWACYGSLWRSVPAAVLLVCLLRRAVEIAS